MSAALTSRSKRQVLVVLLALAVISPWPILALTYRKDLNVQLVAIPSQGPTLAAPLAPAFSRGSYFILVDLQSGQVEALENPYWREQHAVGVRCAALLRQHAVGVVLARDIGPEPFNNLSARGVRVFRTTAVTVEVALARYRRGELVQLQQPSVPTHFGLDPQGALAGGGPPCPLDRPTPAVSSGGATQVALPCYVGLMHPGTTPPQGPTPSPPSLPVALTRAAAIAPPQSAAVGQSLPSLGLGQPLQIPELGLEVVPFSDGGVQVQRVYHGSPAEQGGVVAGDYLLELNGRPVLDAVRLIFLVTTAAPGSPLPLRLVRRGQVVTATVIVPQGAVAGMELPADAAPVYGMRQAAPDQAAAPATAARSGPVQVPELGLEIAPLAGGGLQVARVYKGSWAEQGGLQQGDVVIKLAGKNVRDLASFFQQVQAAAPEAPAPVTLLRQGQVLVAQVTVGEGEMETVQLPANPAPAYKAPAVTPSPSPSPSPSPAPAPAPAAAAAGQPAAWRVLPPQPGFAGPGNRFGSGGTGPACGPSSGPAPDVGAAAGAW